MFVVRFIMADGTVDQEYWYHKKEDAEFHMSLFSSADADIYFAIQLLSNEKLLVNRILDFTADEMTIILNLDCTEQTDACKTLSQMADATEDSAEKEKLILLRIKVEKLNYNFFGKYVQIMNDAIS